MILTQTHKRRSFVGSLNAGSDLIETFRRLCVDNAILCGFFSGTGYLRDVRLRTFDAKTRAFSEPRLYPGTFHAVTLTGNISLAGRETSIRCHVSGLSRGPAPEAGEPAEKAGATPMPAGGEIVSAEVVGLEFMLESVDDLKLYRDLDERSGLDGWLRLEFASGGGNPIVRQTPRDPGEPAPTPKAAREATAPAPAATPASSAVSSKARKKTDAPAARATPSVDDDIPTTEETLQDIRVGDLLNHPTLGQCIVVSTDLEDRLQIKLESGRVVELHTGLIDIAPFRPGPGGERTFAVSIRRRR
jgi:predicted DNA-binding protein with PD1-like motif